MTIRLIKNLAFSSLMLAATETIAEDIDLFIGDPASTGKPNVLIILDNTANWNIPFSAEMGAISSAVGALNSEGVNIGLMLFTETGNPNDNIEGGYIRSAIRNLADYEYISGTTTDDDGNTVQIIDNKFADLLNNLDKDFDKGNGAIYGLAMAEAYRYFAGTEAYSGFGKVKRDYDDNNLPTSGNQANDNPLLEYSNEIYALSGNAFSGASDEEYNSPLTEDNPCGDNIIIFISNGPANDNQSSSRTSANYLESLGGDTEAIILSPNGQQSNMSDEWARFLYQNDFMDGIEGTQNVITYTIDIREDNVQNQDRAQTALLSMMAEVGGGKHFLVEYATEGNNIVDQDDVAADIAEVLNTIFSEIQAENSVFASASLPVSVNAQGTYLNQIFIGMFRPDSQAKPRWDGNLKQYQFIAEQSGDSFTLKLADKNGNAAINTLSGFISSCAYSFWTPDTVNSYWDFTGEFQRSPGSCLAVENSSWSDSPDGDLVERGASSYRLRLDLDANLNNRNVKTCDPASCSTLTNFASNNNAITAALLGVGSGEEDDLIDWVRGQDIDDENINSATNDSRPSAHGDIVHSRPLAIDYGGSTGVVVFYGGNDGMFRAINGNQSSSIGTFAAGNELWSFVAPEHFVDLNRNRINEPRISFPGIDRLTVTVTDPDTGITTTTYSEPELTPKDYFFDGAIGAYKSGTTTRIYPTMRRGGRMLYAFNVDDPTSPSVAWKAGCPLDLTDDTGCTTGLTGMGQTWSVPKVTKTAGYVDDNGDQKPLIIMGGGYDTCEDDEPNTCSSPKGNHIYVFDALDGTLLTTLDTIRSVPAEVTVIDFNGDGTNDYAYTVDMGGNIYRINIGSNAPANWTITHLAAFGCDTSDFDPTAASPCPSNGNGDLNRKFMYPPEVVVTGDFNAVLVGSGDREHPLRPEGYPSDGIADATDVENAFFMIKDFIGTSGWLSDEDNCGTGATVLCIDALARIDPDNTASTPTPADPYDPTLDKGWYLDFDSSDSDHDNEQVVTSAVVIGGIAYFSTHIPTPPPLCGSDLGTARAYAVGFLNAGRREGDTRAYEDFVGGGLPPSPVAGLVEVDDPRTEDPDDTIVLPFLIGGKQTDGPSSPLEGLNPGETASGARTRAYWHVEK